MKQKIALTLMPEIIKVKRTIIPALLLIVCISSCKKDADSDVEFIRFKLDGNIVQISGCPTDYYVGGGYFTDDVLSSGDTLYQFIGGVTPCSAASPNVSLHIVDKTIISEKNYPYSFSPSNPLSLRFYYSSSTDAGYYHSIVSPTTGNINFISIEKAVGGTVKGKFNFQNIGYSIDSNNLISDGHVVSDGEFQIKIWSVETP